MLQNLKFSPLRGNKRKRLSCNSSHKCAELRRSCAPYECFCFAHIQEGADMCCHKRFPICDILLFYITLINACWLWTLKGIRKKVFFKAKSCTLNGDFLLPKALKSEFKSQKSSRDILSIYVPLSLGIQTLNLLYFWPRFVYYETHMSFNNNNNKVIISI